ncbi:MAG: hypothetical protein ACREJX_20575 [Polyangiaceae bacterium]
MFLNPSTDSMLFRKTISTIGVMLAAWAVFIGGITLVMLFAISHAKPEIPDDSSAETTAADHASTPRSTEPFTPSRASRAKPPTLDAPKPARLRI